MKTPMRTQSNFRPSGLRYVTPRPPARAAFANAMGAFALTAAALLVSGTASAQTAQTDNTANSQALEQITVTGSRLQARGFDAPAPTTTINLADIESRGLPNIADYLNELPAFVATDSPTSRSFYPQQLGLNLLDLRGLGANRTLVLVDGRRQVPTTVAGEIDINTVPQALIERVEVVTGGASADWGSDAVAGVVNILLDHDLEGLRTSVQYGESTKHDSGSTHASIAYGAAAGDDNGHFVVAAEYEKDNGLESQTDRELGRQGWALVPNPAFSGPGGVPANLLVRNAGLIFQQGGVVLYPGPIAGTTFGPGGSVGQLDTGQYVAGGQWIVGGAGALSDSQLVPDTRRKSLMAMFNRDLAAGLKLYFEGSYAESTGSANIVSPFALPQTIQSDNAYIPAAFKTTLDTNGITSFDLYRFDSDFGFIRTTQQVETFTVTAGLEGQLGPKWTWDVYAKDGDTANDLRERNLLVQNLAFASDAVVSPGTGQIACRASVTSNPAANNCIPVNLFGLGSPSAAGIAYVMGTGFQNTDLVEQSAAATLRGSLFEGWAGPVSVAIGAEGRRDHIKTTVDSHDQNGDFLISNFQPIEGQINVSEVFLETGVPLLSNFPLAKSLDLNAAVRLTHYSTSGSVSTWKAGLTYAPVEDIKFRGTVSRDIRAPNVGELFAGQQTTFTTVNDPFTNASVFIKDLLSGNLALKPESATTKTFGIVFQPGAAPGLLASVDAYDIELERQIATVDPQDALNQCFAGDATLCGLFTRDASGQLTEVKTPFLNIASSRFSGVDFELDYRKGLQDMFPKAVGAVTLRLFANYVDKVELSNFKGSLINYVGSLASNLNNPDVPALPRWRSNGSVTYDLGPLSLVTSVRHIGSGHYASYFTSQDLSAEQNSVGSRTYVNASMRYAFKVRKAQMEAFVGINNAFDTVAPPLPTSFISQQPNSGVLYDQIGRFVYGGLRLNMN